MSSMESKSIIGELSLKYTPSWIVLKDLIDYNVLYCLSDSNKGRINSLINENDAQGFRVSYNKEFIKDYGIISLHSISEVKKKPEKVFLAEYYFKIKTGFPIIFSSITDLRPLTIKTNKITSEISTFIPEPLSAESFLENYETCLEKNLESSLYLKKERIYEVIFQFPESKVYASVRDENSELKTKIFTIIKRQDDEEEIISKRLNKIIKDYKLIPSEY